MIDTAPHADREVAAATDGGPGPAWSSAPLGIRLAALLAFLAGGVALQLLRTPGIHPWRSLQAEDGGIFYTEALNDPLVRTIGRAYEGYLHVVPRLIAAVASLVPVRDGAVVINVGAALVVALLAGYVWSAARDLLPSPWGRALLVAVMLLLPSAGWEVNASINNLHWYLDFACFWVFLARPRTRWDVAAGVLVAAAAALSDPLSALLLPLAGYRILQALRRRDGVRRPALVAPAVFLVGLVLQATYGVTEKVPHAFVEVDWRDVPGTYGLRVAGSLLVGDRYLERLFLSHEHFATACLLVAVVAAAAAVVVARGRRITVAVVLAYSGVFLAVPLMIRGTSIYLDRAHFTLNGSRYMLVPALMLVSGLLIALFRVREHPARWTLAGRVLATLLVVVVLTANFRLQSSRSAGPEWASGLAAAEARCRDHGGDQPGSRASAKNTWATVVRPGQVAIPTAPGTATRSQWNVVVDCSRLDAGVTAGR
jgi:hypothetical protein